MTPDEYTNQEFYLPVGDGHDLYVHDWGKSDAKQPILFLHGGPGGGVHDRYKTTYDPSKQRVIFFSQRGSGQSRPYGELSNNTTDKLVGDIIKILDHLKLDTVVITGGSWGSCLGLVFAIQHPKRVSAMVLRGIYTGTRAENEWLTHGGFRYLFPDVWDRYIKATPEPYKTKPSEYHLKRILGEDVAAATASAYAYGNLENALLSLDDRFIAPTIEDFDMNMTRIEVQYVVNNCFLPDNYIIDNAHKLTMPIWLIQGRYDIVCPPITAYELNKKLPNGNLVWTVAGHGNDRPTYDVHRTLLLQIASD
jgi:proline iminopeptidase